MTRTRLEEPLAERLHVLREVRDAMLLDAESQPEDQRQAARAYAFAVYTIRVTVEKWLDRNVDAITSVQLGSSLMGAAMQVVQTALLVSTNDKFTRGAIFGKFINHTAKRLIEEGMILSPQEARAQLAKKETARTGGILGPDGKPVRVQ